MNLGPPYADYGRICIMYVFLDFNLKLHKSIFEEQWVEETQTQTGETGIYAEGVAIFPSKPSETLPGHEERRLKLRLEGQESMPKDWKWRREALRLGWAKLFSDRFWGHISWKVSQLAKYDSNNKIQYHWLFGRFIQFKGRPRKDYQLELIRYKMFWNWITNTIRQYDPVLSLLGALIDWTW